MGSIAIEEILTTLYHKHYLMTPSTAEAYRDRGCLNSASTTGGTHRVNKCIVGSFMHKGFPGML